MTDLLHRQRNGTHHDNILAWVVRVRRYFLDGDTVLDIGCGLGQVDLVLTSQVDVRMIMIDRTGDEPHVRYSQFGYAHNDLDETRRRVGHLGEVHDVDEYRWLDRPRVVMSTLSWGFHYPIELYWTKVMRMEPHHIIVDLRKPVDTLDGYDKVDEFKIYGKAITHVFRRRRC